MTWLQQQEIDVSIGLLGGKSPTGINMVPIFKMPLVLLVPKKSKLISAEQLWQKDRIDETLITVPSNQPICRAFQDGLSKLKVDWFSGIEVSTVEMVQIYVANNYGIGVTVGAPKMEYHPDVRVLPLEGFGLVTFGVLWQGRKTELLESLLLSLNDTAKDLVSGFKSTTLSV
jgi:DNA-binding transcriptional LysR family regulator